MKIIIGCLIFLYSQLSMANDLGPLMKKCDSFLMKRKYDSAFRLLHRADSFNLNAEILYKKQEIAMNFFLAQDKYQSFSFADIEPFQAIQNFRNKGLSNTVYYLPFNKP